MAVAWFRAGVYVNPVRVIALTVNTTEGVALRERLALVTLHVPLEPVVQLADVPGVHPPLTTALGKAAPVPSRTEMVTVARQLLELTVLAAAVRLWIRIVGAGAATVRKSWTERMPRESGAGATTHPTRHPVTA